MLWSQIPWTWLGSAWSYLALEMTKKIPSKSKFTKTPPSFDLALSLTPAGWQNTSEGCKTSACGPDTAAISGIESNKTNRLGAPLHSTVKFQDFQRLTNSLSTDFPRVHILFGQSLWHITAISCLALLLQIKVAAKTQNHQQQPWPLPTWSDAQFANRSALSTATFHTLKSLVWFRIFYLLHI